MIEVFFGSVVFGFLTYITRGEDGWMAWMDDMHAWMDGMDGMDG